jgi:chemotaxis protein methyltransferase CheR
MVAGTDSGREFHFTEQDFQKVRKLIYDYAGIALSDSKHDMVYSRLARRVRALKLANFADYLALLQKPEGRKEWESFVNSLTTNLTSFFREEHHFDILREHLAKRRNAGPMSIWCSASSTGEEPYSIAMTAVETFDSFTPPVKIIATDLDTNVLEHAGNGVYSADVVSRLKPERLRRFFTLQPDGSAKVKPELRAMITFRQLNLIENNWSIRGPFEAIFCRNVMIYFDKPTQSAILKRFAPMLHANGLLFAGHSENFFHAADLFRLRGKTVYELTSTSQARLE